MDRFKLRDLYDIVFLYRFAFNQLKCFSHQCHRFGIWRMATKVHQSQQVPKKIGPQLSNHLYLNISTSAVRRKAFLQQEYDVQQVAALGWRRRCPRSSPVSPGRLFQYCVVILVHLKKTWQLTAPGHMRQKVPLISAGAILAAAVKCDVLHKLLMRATSQWVDVLNSNVHHYWYFSSMVKTDSSMDTLYLDSDRIGLEQFLEPTQHDVFQAQHEVGTCVSELCGQQTKNYIPGVFCRCKTSSKVGSSPVELRYSWRSSASSSEEGGIPGHTQKVFSVPLPAANFVQGWVLHVSMTFSPSREHSVDVMHSHGTIEWNACMSFMSI